MSNNTSSIQKSSCCTPSATRVHERTDWSYAPAIDVYETPTAFVIEFDAPGLKPDGIDLTLEQGVLRLHGQVAQRASVSTPFLRQEYGVGDFDREIPLGRIADQVNGEQISAEYAHGVLTVQLPKLEVAKTRRIEVKKTTA